jgi:hypothetical protein
MAMIYNYYTMSRMDRAIQPGAVYNNVPAATGVADRTWDYVMIYYRYTSIVHEMLCTIRIEKRRFIADGGLLTNGFNTYSLLAITSEDFFSFDLSKLKKNI